MWATDPFETIRALAAGMRGGQGLPRFVEQEFRDFLTCGCLALSRMGETVPAIGAGGMGEVYRARDTRLHRDVAVKIISAGSAGDPDRRRRFELTPADSVADPPQNSRGAPEHCTAPFFECSSVPRLAQLFAERANAMRLTRGGCSRAFYMATQRRGHRRVQPLLDSGPGTALS